jgi:hypothetical protein
MYIDLSSRNISALLPLKFGFRKPHEPMCEVSTVSMSELKGKGRISIGLELEDRKEVRRTEGICARAT